MFELISKKVDPSGEILWTYLAKLNFPIELSFRRATSGEISVYVASNGKRDLVKVTRPIESLKAADFMVRILADVASYYFEKIVEENEKRIKRIGGAV